MSDGEKITPIESRLAKEQLEKIKEKESKKTVGQIRSKTQKDFYSRARKAIEQVKMLKQLLIDLEISTEEELDSLLDNVEDPGSVRVQRQIKKIRGE